MYWIYQREHVNVTIIFQTFVYLKILVTIRLLCSRHKTQTLYLKIICWTYFWSGSISRVLVQIAWVPSLVILWPCLYSELAAVCLARAPLPYLAARVSLIRLGWNRCQKHALALADLNFVPISSLFCGYLLLCRCPVGVPRGGMQVLLAQAFVATGGVKDVGLELGAHGLIAGEGHGDSGETLRSIIATSQGC